MRSKRYDLATVELDGEDVRLKYGDLLVVAHEGRDELDWEVQLVPFDPAALEQAPYHVDAVTLEGTRLRGDAVLVRSVSGMHVLRGAGPLDGVDPAELA